MQRFSAEQSTATAKRNLWVSLIVLGSIGFSFIFACATPFAALASMAALGMPRRDVFAVVGLAWLANQGIGYGLLGYPQTWDSFAWGAVIGIAAGLGAWAAISVAERLSQHNRLLVIGLSFLAAFVGYQLTLRVAGFVVGGSGDFSLAIVTYVLKVNLGGLAAVLLAHRLAVATGFVGTAETAVDRSFAA